ncbi:hypothetical protein [Streptomyces marokkonensis]
MKVTLCAAAALTAALAATAPIGAVGEVGGVGAAGAVTPAAYAVDGTAQPAAADSRDEARPEPPGTAHTVTGLVLAGIAAVAVALRGVRSRSRGTD